VASAAPPYRIEVKERVELYLYPRWTFVAWLRLAFMWYGKRFVVSYTLIGPCWPKFGGSSVDALRCREQ
jgi:hypothetical protein